MERYRLGQSCIRVTIPNAEGNTVDSDRLLKVAESLGHLLFQHLWLTDQATGLVSRTNEPALILKLMERRQSQTREKKYAAAYDNNHIDELTGQPTTDSKASGMSSAQSLILLSRGLNNSAKEFAWVRGGNGKAFNASNRLIHESGEASIEEVETVGGHAKSTETVSTYFTAQHLENNLLRDFSNE